MSTSERCTDPPTFVLARSNFQDWLRCPRPPRSLLPRRLSLTLIFAFPAMQIPLTLFSLHSPCFSLFLSTSLHLSRIPRLSLSLSLLHEDAILSTDHAFTAYTKSRAKRSRAASISFRDRRVFLLILRETRKEKGQGKGRKRSGRWGRVRASRRVRGPIAEHPWWWWFLRCGGLGYTTSDTFARQIST